MGGERVRSAHHVRSFRSSRIRGRIATIDGIPFVHDRICRILNAIAVTTWSARSGHAPQLRRLQPLRWCFQELWCSTSLQRLSRLLSRLEIDVPMQ